MLCNAELRAKYDAYGAEALNVDFMDSSEFFTALFGSDRCAGVLGRLWVISRPCSGHVSCDMDSARVLMAHRRCRFSWRACASLHAKKMLPLPSASQIVDKLLSHAAGPSVKYCASQCRV